MLGWERGSFCVRLVRFPDSNPCSNSSGTGEEVRADFFEKVFRHVFGGWVVWQDEQAAGGDHLECIDGVCVRVADEKAVVPVFIDPAFAAGFEVGKIHDATDGVLGVAGDKKVADVVVAVEVLAFATVLIESVSGAELDPPHDGQSHFCLGFCKGFGAVTAVLDFLHDALRRV